MRAGWCTCGRRQRHRTGRCKDCRDATAGVENRAAERAWLARYGVKPVQVSQLVRAAATLRKFAPGLRQALWDVNVPAPERVQEGLALALLHLVDGWRTRRGPGES